MLKEFLRKHLPFKVISILRSIYEKEVALIYYILRIFPINKRKIIISNYIWKGYGDNGKYIVQEMIRRNLNYDLVWIVDSKYKNNFPKQVRTVQYGSFRAKYEEVTAKIWIDNCRKSSSVRKRKGQFYIQTWHGGIALKRIEKDVEPNLGKDYVKNAKHDSKIADLFISNSKFCTELYLSSFWYTGAILECGYPRNDILINFPENIRNKVFEHFGLEKDTKIILYAPTFRADKNMDGYKLNYNKILRELKIYFGCNIVCLVRLHPNISQNADSISYNDKIINATYYNDMQELMAVSDILITDYSSTMFEFMLMKKPVFLFTTDLDKYKQDRDFYFDVNKLPFPKADCNEKLIECMNNFNETEYLNAVISFTNKIGLKENGRAAETIVNKIETIIESSI